MTEEVLLYRVELFTPDHPTWGSEIIGSAGRIECAELLWANTNPVSKHSHIRLMAHPDLSSTPLAVRKIQRQI